MDVERLREALDAGPAGVAALLNDHPSPVVRLLAERMARRSAEQEGQDSGGGEPAEPPTLPSEVEIEMPRESPSARELRLRRHLGRLERELERFSEFSEALADALGACPLCWGDDVECPRCAGAGRPGAAVPDKPLFLQFVVPAVRRMADARRARLGDRGAPPADGAIGVLDHEDTTPAPRSLTPLRPPERRDA